MLRVIRLWLAGLAVLAAGGVAVVFTQLPSSAPSAGEAGRSRPVLAAASAMPVIAPAVVTPPPAAAAPAAAAPAVQWTAVPTRVERQDLPRVSAAPRQAAPPAAVAQPDVVRTAAPPLPPRVLTEMGPGALREWCRSNPDGDGCAASGFQNLPRQAEARPGRPRNARPRAVARSVRQGPVVREATRAAAANRTAAASFERSPNYDLFR